MEAIMPYILVAVIVGGSFQIGWLLVNALYKIIHLIVLTIQIKNLPKQIKKDYWGYLEETNLNGQKVYVIYLVRKGNIVDDSALCEVYDEPDAKNICHALNVQKYRRK